MVFIEGRYGIGRGEGEGGRGRGTWMAVFLAFWGGWGGGEGGCCREGWEVVRLV